MKEDNRNIALLGKYLFGGCSNREKKSVERWLNQSHDNQAYYNDYKKVWDFAGIDEPDFPIDAEKGWEELNKRINALEPLNGELQKDKFVISKRFIYRAMRVAAVLIFAFGLFYLFNNVKNQKPENLTFATTEVVELPFVLDDGSKIFLNKRAEINYPEKFTSKERVINFEGEAFFEIAHNPDKPFIFLRDLLSSFFLNFLFPFFNINQNKPVSTSLSIQQQ